MLRACALMLALTTISAAAEIPIKDFVRKSDYFSAKISPKGEYLALSKPHDDSNAIVVIDLKGMKVAGAVSFGHGQWADRFWWVAPDRIVIAMA